MLVSIALDVREEDDLWRTVLDNVTIAVKEWASVADSVISITEPYGDYVEKIDAGVEFNVVDGEQIQITLTPYIVISGLERVVRGANRDITCEKLLVELIKHGVERLDESDVNLIVQYGVFGEATFS